MNVTIVPAAAADAKALAVIQKKAFKRLYRIYRDEGSPYLRGADEILKWLEQPDRYVYKIFADGLLCGGIIIFERLENPGEYYLARLYILPEMQRKGIANAAITLCEAEFPNARRWTLDFPADQIANRRCYEKAGYTDTSGRILRFGKNGKKLVLAIYEKNL